MRLASDRGVQRECSEVCIQKSRLTPLGMKTKDIPDSTSVMVCAALPDGCKLFKAAKDVVSGDVVACAICVCVCSVFGS